MILGVCGMKDNRGNWMHVCRGRCALVLSRDWRGTDISFFFFFLKRYFGSAFFMCFDKMLHACMSSLQSLSTVHAALYSSAHSRLNARSLQETFDFSLSERKVEGGRG